MRYFSLEIIGTHLSLSVDTDHEMEGVFSHIGTYLRSFEARYSRFLEGNWLHDLNTSRRGTLDPEGRYMLEYMLDLAMKTDGYFDPTVGKRLTELGYGRITNKSTAPVIPGKSGIQISEARNMDCFVSRNDEECGYKNIEILGDEVILHGDIMLEFGGVGKGYLIDQIKISLDKYPRFLINFGGDIYGKGGWKVGLESPFASDEVIGTIVLEDNFLACSAGTRRKWGTHHHLIDPHTGESAREVIASYVEGSSGIVTDAYATTLCVMPWDLAIETLAKTPEISGVIVRHDGKTYQKEGSQAELFS